MGAQSTAVVMPARAADVRDRLLDAAEGCLAKYGASKTSMEDVAKTAGLSRATVYRYFENRDALLLGVASRQASNLAKESLAYLAQFDNMTDWLVEGVLYALREIPKRPAFASLAMSLDSTTASRLFLGSTGMIEIGANVLNPMFATAKAQGLIREDIEVDMLIEWLLRVLWTYLNAPSQVATDEEGMRKLFRMMLIPAVLKDA
jgi:AcrR family transcriptional regulator